MKTQERPSETQLIILQFLETACALVRRLDCQLSFQGTSFSEYRLLRALASVGKTGYPRIDLANTLGLSASAVTCALKPLEKLGYVRTKPSARDAGKSLAVITEAGLERCSDARTMLDDLLAGSPIKELGSQETNEFEKRLRELAAI